MFIIQQNHGKIIQFYHGFILCWFYFITQIYIVIITMDFNADLLLEDPTFNDDFFNIFEEIAPTNKDFINKAIKAINTAYLQSLTVPFLYVS